MVRPTYGLSVRTKGAIVFTGGLLALATSVIISTLELVLVIEVI
jgi:hypothetical protein